MVRKELEEARVRLYQKKDRSRIVLAVGIALFLVFLFLGILNLIGSVNLSLKAGLAPMMVFLTYMVLAMAAFCGPYGFYFSRKQRNVK